MITVDKLTDEMVRALRVEIEHRIFDLRLLDRRCESCLMYPVGDKRVSAESLMTLRQRICDAINAAARSRR